MKRIKIGEQWIGEREPTYIIAEIGSNFDGNTERAKMLIDLVKDCGADAVKFQCFTANKIVSKEGFEGLKMGFQTKWEKPVYEVYKSAEFPREWHDELFHYANKKGLHFLSTPYDKEAVDILDELGVPAFKIGSGDITWHEMLKYIAKKGKPIILSTGASTVAEIDEAVKAIRSEGNDEIILLQCVTNYPSHFEYANILAMKAMGELFDVLVGYSDHTPGIIVPLGSVALGACIIEKHFTDNKDQDFRDHHLSADFEEMKLLVSKAKLIKTLLGRYEKNPIKPIESKERIRQFRRAIYPKFDLQAGTILTKENITTLRPNTGIDARNFYKVLGKKLKKDKKAFEAIYEGDLSVS